MPVDAVAIDADFYVWTGHKALGPTGIGVLHGSAEILEEMEPFFTGGDMIASVSFEGATWNELPFKFEAGTPPIAEAVGLGAAVDYLPELGMERVRSHERELTAYMMERLREVQGLHFVGPPEAENRGGIPSFTIEGMHAHDIAELANREGVCIGPATTARNRDASSAYPPRPGQAWRVQRARDIDAWWTRSLRAEACSGSHSSDSCERPNPMHLHQT